jgi:hypothetical protein
LSPPDEFDLSGGQLETDVTLGGGTLAAETELQPGALEYDPVAEETHWEIVQW